MNYWLMKSEPDAFSIDDLSRLPKKTGKWDGVRNYMARNHLKEMKKGDLAFFYHSSAKVIGIVGVCEIVKEAYPDPTAFIENDDHYDPKSNPKDPKWFMVDIKLKKKFNKIISRDELKDQKTLENMQLFKLSRLSVSKVTKKEFDKILSLSS